MKAKQEGTFLTLYIFIIEFNFENDTLPRWRKSLKLVLIEIQNLIDEKKQAPCAPTIVFSLPHNMLFQMDHFLTLKLSYNDLFVGNY
jgi:hypothetical protein